MRSIVVWLSVAAIGLSACGGAGVTEAARPRTSEGERAQRGPKRTPPPPLIAPPPAYGNKIVLAEPERAAAID